MNNYTQTICVTTWGASAYLTADEGLLYNCNYNSIGGASAWYFVPVSSLDITLNNGGDGSYYATLYLPFDATISGANAYTLSVSGNYAIPSAVPSNQVPAGTPVLLKGETTSATATINTGAAFNSGSPYTSALTGTYVDLAVNGDVDYFLGLGEHNTIGFYNWKGATLRANRAYMTAAQAEAAVKGLFINWDFVDGIKPINNEQLAKDQFIFNLAGQRMSRVQKGVNIVNGKKVLVK